IECRRTGAREDQASLFIDAETTPLIRAACRLPRIALPRIVTELAGVRDGVKDPFAFAGTHVVGADMSWRGAPGALSVARAEDDQVFVDGSGRTRRAQVRQRFGVHFLGQVHAAAGAERGNQFAGLGVEAVEALAGRVENALVRLLRVLPVSNSA